MAAPGPTAAVPSLRYTLSMPLPQSHYFEVKMELGGFGADYTDLKLPVWAPGSYLVREFARHVEGLRAQGAGGQAHDADGRAHLRGHRSGAWHHQPVVGEDRFRTGARGT